MATCEKCGNKYLTRECLKCRDKEKKTNRIYGNKEDYENSLKHNNRYNKKEIPNLNEKNLNNKKHANFLIRFLASLIDTILISLPIALIFGQYFADAIGAIIIISFWIFWNGQTPGKKILNLKIVNENYFEIDFKTATIRYLGYFVSILTFFIGFAIVAFREDRRGLHDIIAKTYVIHTDKDKTNFESDTADKIFAITSIFSGIILVIFSIISYQQTKIFNEMFYGSNDKKIIEQKQNQMTQQNKMMIDEMNKANKNIMESNRKLMKEINKGFKIPNFNNSQRGN